MGSWKDNVRLGTPYIPGEQPQDKNVIKLNTNENPYPPAPGVAKVLHEMDAADLRRYEDPKCTALISELASFYGVGEDQVFVGAGSDDVLAMSFFTFFNSKKPILFPDITYSFYPVLAGLLHIPYKTVPLDEDYKIRPEDYSKENGGIVFANPNAPTGIYLPVPGVEQILMENPDVVVIVDEAYIDFCGGSATELIRSYENLLVVQTFSKSRSLAGMRIGFALGSPAIIKALTDVRDSCNPYCLNLPAILAGVEAVKDRAYFDRTIEKIIDTRERAKERLKSLGFTCLDSRANFIYASHEKVSGSEIYKAMAAKDIYLRFFKGPRLDEFIRITMGTDEQMDALYGALKSYLEEV